MQTEKPYYNKKLRCWCLKTEYGEEIGDASYIASEFIKDGVIYPFHTEPPETEQQHNHEHGFDAVLEYVLRCPKYFSIEGFEEYYSMQEQRILEKLWEKMK